MKERQQWGSRIGFILAAVGSAIGLGNIWRFPYQAYSNGGGAFLIPYLFAMLTAGIPILILEFGLGHKLKGGAPTVFARLTSRIKGLVRFEWIGWWQILVAVVIATYYVIIIAWTLSYTFLSFTQGWGTDTSTFFFSDFLKLSDNPFSMGGINWPILAALAAVWGIGWYILHSGVSKGIELANKIFMPTLIVMILFLTFRSLTLEGASAGLEWLFKPDFSKLADIKVWTSAYGQIFYSMSIGFAIMITYASYLPDKSDIVNNGFMTGLLNCGFSILSGIMIFAILGYMAGAQGVGVDEVVGAGIGLAFVTIPQAINLMPAPWLVGPLFFLSLTIAGLSSSISINETVIASFVDKFGFNRKKTVTVFCVIGFLVSTVYATGAGLYILDIVDAFINNFGILFVGLVEILLLSWIFKLDTFKNYVNPLSDFPVGRWWNFCLRVITPVVLGSIALLSLAGELNIGAQTLVDKVNGLEAVKDAGITVVKDQVAVGYSGYDPKALLAYGWSVVLGIFLLSFVFQRIKGVKSHDEEVAS
ncbi:MAG: sodium-dependent transporter [Spirochaetales bacterium]|nr:sodium-dependent transporter [Spirochaetales bacterium]